MKKLDQAIRNSEKGQIDIGLFEARKKMLKPELQSGVQRADSIMHSSPPVQEAKRLLGLPAKQWYTLELEAAQKYGDSGRVQQCKLRLWEIDMAAVGDGYARWSNWQGLRTPQEYAKGKFFGKTKCAEGMCMADKAIVNQPLTKDMSPEFKKMAKDMNKAVLAFVGLKNDPRGPDQAAVDALSIASRSPGATNELYCQIFKATSQSPKVQDPQVYEKAFDLLGIALYSFVPQDEELLKHAFMVAFKKSPRYAKCASHGKFTPSGPPRGGMDITKIRSDIDTMNQQPGAFLSLV